MPISNRSGQVISPILTNVARAFAPEGYIYNEICPTVPVPRELFQYEVWAPRDFFINDVETMTPDRAETREIDLEVSYASAVAEDHALKISYSQREVDNSDSNVAEKKTRLLQGRLLLAQEIRLANLLNTQDATPAGGLDNSMDSTPSNNWNVDAGTIETDVVQAKEAIYDAIGVEPNTIVIPYKVANAISIQQDIRDIFKYTVDGRQLLGAGQNILPPEIWGLRVVIPRGRKMTSNQGATDVYADTWGDEVRVLHVAPPNTENPGVCYRFQARGPKVTRWMENDPDGVTWIRNSSGVLVEAVVSPFAGFVIKDVLS